MIMHRHQLSDGRIITIQKIGRKYACYIVGHGFDAPEYLVREGYIDTCREALAIAIANDVCEND